MHFPGFHKMAQISSLADVALSFQVICSMELIMNERYVDQAAD
jgi:hypothetical protein